MAISPSSIQAVLFDFGMVLSMPPNPAAWARMRQLTGFDEPTLQQAYWHPRLDYDRGLFTGPQYWVEVARLGGSKLDQPTLHALIDADTALWTDPNTPMADWAKRLQPAGIRVGILSNLGDAMTAGVVKRWPWIQTFDSLTWSHQIGSIKPEAKSYQHAVQQLNLPAENILFIDDRAGNIAGAEAVGLQAIQYIDQQQFEDEIKTRGLQDVWLAELRPALK